MPAAREDETAIAFVSSGKVLPRHEVRIVDEIGNEVPDRTEGFLWFRGPSATSGYYRNPKATEALLPRGPATDPEEYAWVNSGDRAYCADGEIYVTGRVKDIIIKGGRNLYPHEVEDLAARADGIRKGCIVAFGLRDEATGTEKLVVVAETREREASRRAALASAVTDLVSRGLGLPPDRVELIPPGSIPKTSSGKLRREETKQLYLAGTLSASRAPAWLQIARLGTGSVVRNLGREVLAGIKRGLEILYGVYFGVVFLLWTVPTWVMVQFIKEHMETPGAKIYASNHASYFDVLPLMLGLGVPYRFVAKMEVGSMPFIGTFLKRMGHLKFDRTDPESRLRQAQQLEEFLRNGESVFVFPEVTFTAEDGVRPFQLGAFNAAVVTGAPIIPVSLA